MQLIAPHHHTAKNDHTVSPSQARGGLQQSSSLPAVKSAAVQSLPSSGKPLDARKRQSSTKPVTLSQLHKLITDRNSLDEVIKDKPRVRISITKTELGDGETSSRPKVKVMILNKQNTQVPMLPKTINNETDDVEQNESSKGSEERFLYEEWRFIPNFNQKELLSQLDSKGLRSLERTRAWLLSIPLDGTNDAEPDTTSMMADHDK